MLSLGLDDYREPEADPIAHGSVVTLGQIFDGTARSSTARFVDFVNSVPQDLLLIPKDERKVVQDLDASCDRLLEPVRSRPIVLFLMRDGDGARTMASEAPSLWSWIGGRVSDPEMRAEIDVPRQRAAFEARHGSSPEAWLAWWRSGSLPKTAANFHTAHEAVFLEESK